MTPMSKSIRHRPEKNDQELYEELKSLKNHHCPFGYGDCNFVYCYNRNNEGIAAIEKELGPVKMLEFRVKELEADRELIVKTECTHKDQLWRVGMAASVGYLVTHIIFLFLRLS